MINNREAIAAAYAWWVILNPDPARNHPGDRGALARLRRCASVAEAMQQPDTIDLFRRCRATHEQDLIGVALAAAVLAHVRQDRPGPPVARQVGPENPEKPETALLKPLRFRRLLEASEPDDCLAAFRRLVALAGGEVNLRDLTRALFDWPNRHQAEETKRRWIFAYWNANPAPASAPGATPAEASAA
jgi:CRISPR system Cascade subunit CasB